MAFLFTTYRILYLWEGKANDYKLKNVTVETKRKNKEAGLKVRAWVGGRKEWELSLGS